MTEHVTVGYVARCCGVSNTTVLRWIEKGLLQAIRLPSGHYRIGEKDLTGFLKACRHTETGKRG